MQFMHDKYISFIKKIVHILRFYLTFYFKAYNAN